MKQILRNGNYKTIEYIKRKIHYWLRYINECIIFYGDEMEYNEIFYHVVDTVLSIQTMDNLIIIPFSTTILSEIAVKFSNMKQNTINWDGIYFKNIFLYNQLYECRNNNIKRYICHFDCQS